jgi:hypothetical protein
MMRGFYLWLLQQKLYKGSPNKVHIICTCSSIYPLPLAGLFCKNKSTHSDKTRHRQLMISGSYAMVEVRSSWLVGFNQILWQFTVPIPAAKNLKLPLLLSTLNKVERRSGGGETGKRSTAKSLLDHDFTRWTSLVIRVLYLHP